MKSRTYKVHLSSTAQDLFMLQATVCACGDTARGSPQARGFLLPRGPKQPFGGRGCLGLIRRLDCLVNAFEFNALRRSRV